MSKKQGNSQHQDKLNPNSGTVSFQLAPASSGNQECSTIPDATNAQDKVAHSTHSSMIHVDNFNLPCLPSTRRIECSTNEYAGKPHEQFTVSQADINYNIRSEELRELERQYHPKPPANRQDMNRSININDFHMSLLPQMRNMNQDKYSKNPQDSQPNANASKFSDVRPSFLKTTSLHRPESIYFAFDSKKASDNSQWKPSPLGPKRGAQTSSFSKTEYTSRLKPTRWQATNDMADRKIILKNVFTIIKIFRDSLNINHERLSTIAKKIEKCLYRSAQSKEEYMNISSLRQRIQMIARRSMTKFYQPQTLSLTSRSSNEADQQGTTKKEMSVQNEIIINSLNNSQISSIYSGASSQLTENNASLKKDVHQNSVENKSRNFETQQKRLILLRHASTCTERYCTVKDCMLMVKLWNHLKGCNDKDCKIRHCFSSRCILNHYRICKDTGRYSTCKVCASVTKGTDPLEFFDEIGDFEPLPIIDSKASETSSLEGMNEMKDFQDILVPTSMNALRDISTHRNDIFPQGSLGAFNASSQRKEALGDLTYNDSRDSNITKKYHNMRHSDAKGNIISMMLPIVDGLLNHEFGWVFKDPVDPIELGLPDYFQIVSEPMDLNSIRERLLKGEYFEIDECSRDIRKVFENAIIYNGEDSDVGTMALQMIDAFTAAFKNY